MDKEYAKVVAAQADVWNERFRGVPDAIRALPVSGKTADVTEFLQAQGALRVLDIGCGPGRWCIHFARIGMRPAGVDISSVAIETARRWTAEERLAGEYAVAPATALPFADGEFDAVVASAVIDHMPLATAATAMAEIKRVLKPGGSLFISFDGLEDEPDPFDALPDGTCLYTDGRSKGMIWRHYYDDEARRLLQGFELLDWQQLPSGDRWVFARLGA